MKKINLLILMVLLSFSLLQATYVGKIYFKSQYGKPKSPFFTTQSRHLGLFFDEQIRIGNLKLTKIQNDLIAEMEHHRYSQHYKGLEVYGGQIIKHYKKSEMVGINGEYYRIYDVDTTPVISKEEAVEIFKIDLNEDGLSEVSEESKLLVYPVSDGDYHLAYQVVLERNLELSMTGIVDAMTGEVLLKYSNIFTDDLTIGTGIGYNGGQYKLATTFYEGTYYLYDEGKTRPVNQYTYDFKTFDGQFWYVPSDNDNNWDRDGALVNVHAFLGMNYDYYYIVHRRNGIDNNNMDIKANVHHTAMSDNAAWHQNKMWFYIPGDKNHQNAAALDIVAHEYSHGVTQYHSKLDYILESGALNESFSDIMGTTVEKYWQPEGKGYLKSDWYIAEDANPYFHTNQCRNLANPNTNSQLKNAGYPSYLWYPDPCHLSQKIPIIIWYGNIVDNGGVHLNMTIFSHAYYLLATGGTNKVSGKSVTGIGIEKATQIFYRAWVHYLTKTSNFLVAANALLYSAEYLYGKNSEEWLQTIKALEAIGYTYTG